MTNETDSPANRDRAAHERLIQNMETMNRPRAEIERAKADYAARVGADPPISERAIAAAAAAAPDHRCNGVNGGSRHGTQNRCTICGNCREGFWDADGMEVLNPAAKPEQEAGKTETVATESLKTPELECVRCHHLGRVIARAGGICNELDSSGNIYCNCQCEYPSQPNPESVSATVPTATALPTEDECRACLAAHAGYNHFNHLHTCEAGRVSVSPESGDAQIEGMEHEGSTSIRPLDALHGPQSDASLLAEIEAIEARYQAHTGYEVVDVFRLCTLLRQRLEDDQLFERAFAEWQERLWKAVQEIKGSPNLGMETVLQIAEKQLNAYHKSEEDAVTAERQESQAGGGSEGDSSRVG